ncbi:tyrosine aminotransferase-like [Silene latifolia]|uniref:tyrosine aminotransferase-like n=1 Tax=Silene latifolia TaxID=37657 RepID=UPI003D772FD7
MEKKGIKNWEKGSSIIKSGEKRTTVRAVRATMSMLHKQLNPDDDRVVIPLGHGDPSPFQCFRPPVAAVDAIVDALRSSRFNGYAYPTGFPSAKKAVAEYISRDLPYTLSESDVCITVGCKQAVHAIISSLASPGSNILLPMPTFSMYDACSAVCGVEVRHYNLLPEKEWEVDLHSVEALADENTVAIVLINPGNPCGSVYTHQHLENVAKVAEKLGLLVIADEVYEHITFGDTPFVRMGAFALKAPVLTIGSISKRWLVPGWRIGWLVTTDPNGILQKSELMERIKAFLEVASDPTSFIQGALPEILETTKDEFFSNVNNILRQDADIIYEKLKKIPSISCPNKPQGSMFVMVKLDVSLLDDIEDDTEFCLKVAKEEKVLILPGSALGMKNWLRITFALEPLVLKDGLERIDGFCQRHSKVV